MEVVVVVEEGGMDPAAAASAGAGAKRARARTITRAMARAAPPLRSGGGGPPRCRSAGAMPAGREAAGGGGTLRLLFDGILLARVRAYCTYSIHTTTMYYICIAIHTTLVVLVESTSLEYGYERVHFLIVCILLG